MRKNLKEKKSLKFLRNAYKQIDMKGKFYIQLILIMLVSSFVLSGCMANNKDSADEKENEMSEKINYQYVKKELYTTREDLSIYGELYMPQEVHKKIPTIIYSHGFAGSHEYGIQYAKQLAQKGYAVYCFDFCGGSPSSQSDGSTLDMSIFTEQKDLEAVIEMIQGLDFVDKDNIFLLGSSQGGAVSAITAAANQEKIRGMILLYPAFVLVDLAKELFESVEDIPESYFYRWMSVGKVYFEKLLDYDIYDEISSYDKDVLIIHGDKDDIVPLSYSQKAIEVYSSANLKVVKGAGHGFYDDEFEEAMQYIENYLNEHIKDGNNNG